MLGAYASIAGERLSCSGGVVIDRFEWEEEAGVMKGSEADGMIAGSEVEGGAIEGEVREGGCFPLLGLFIHPSGDFSLPNPPRLASLLRVAWRSVPKRREGVPGRPFVVTAATSSISAGMIALGCSADSGATWSPALDSNARSQSSELRTRRCIVCRKSIGVSGRARARAPSGCKGREAFLKGSLPVGRAGFEAGCPSIPSRAARRNRFRENEN
jgi:hypothetical protein